MHKIKKKKKELRIIEKKKWKIIKMVKDEIASERQTNKLENEIMYEN